MAFRIASSIRLAATRVAGVRVSAPKAFRVPSSSTSLMSRSRFISSTPLLFNESKPSTTEEVAAESTIEAIEQTTESQEAVAADSIVHASEVAAEVEESPEALAARTIFAGGLSWNIDNDWLRDEVYKQMEITEGIVSARVARSNMGKSRGFGFIEFATPALAEQCAQISAEIDGRVPEFRVSSATPTPRAPREFSSDRPERSTRQPIDRSAGPRNPATNTVWVGNVAWAVDEGEINDVFEQFGEIKRVSMPKDMETGRSRGIAYVEFADQASAESAVGSSSGGEGIELEGRTLRLDFAEVKSNNNSFGSRDGGRGGGRGGFGGRDGGRNGGRDGGSRDGGSRGGYGGSRGGFGGGRGGGRGGGGYGGDRGSSGGDRGGQSSW